MKDVVGGGVGNLTRFIAPHKFSPPTAPENSDIDEEETKRERKSDEFYAMEYVCGILFHYLSKRCPFIISY